MRELVVNDNDGGRRLDRFLASVYPHLPAALLQRWIREKRVRLNGRHPSPSARLATGDRIMLFVGDDTLDRPAETPGYLQLAGRDPDIVYEDSHIIAVNKPAGLSVHDDERTGGHTLITLIQAYLYRSGAWDPALENSFAPALCHRLDKNTSGLVLAAKTAPALRILNEKFAAREVAKTYLCLVDGVPSPLAGTLRHILRRDEKQKRVFVYNSPVPGGRTAVLRYQTLGQRNGRSLLEIALLTGRTHQIRAQFAYIGCPLAGDGKYGKADPSMRGQALCAYKLSFAFTTPAPPLDYLNGLTLALSPPTFARDFL